MNNEETAVYLHDEQVYRLVMETLLAHLGLDMTGRRYSDAEILEVVLTAAAQQTSLEQVCNTSEAAPCGNTVRGVLEAQLDVEQVEAKANRMLAQRLPKRLQKKARWIASDLVLVPYHGEPHQDPAEVVRSQAKHGTSHFHAYATAFVVERGRRFTVALTFVRSTDTLTAILERLQSLVRELGLKARCWLLDRQFFTVEVIQHLQARQDRFIIPVVIRGKQEPPGGTRALVAGKTSSWTTYTMHSPQHGAVSFRVAVVAKNWAGRAHKRGRQMLAYAVQGIRTELHAIAEIYRRRFGIETSHRQMHQGRARTSSRSPVLRLLYVAIALLLRNVWAWLHWAVVAEPRRGGRKLRPWLFNLAQMLTWIARLGEEHLRTVRALQVGYPLSVQYHG